MASIIMVGLRGALTEQVAALVAGRLGWPIIRNGHAGSRPAGDNVASGQAPAPLRGPALYLGWEHLESIGTPKGASGSGPVLRVLVHAPVPVRLRRIMAESHLSEIEAWGVAAQDMRQADQYARSAGLAGSVDLDGFDVVLSTAAYSAEQVAALVVAGLESLPPPRWAAPGATTVPPAPAATMPAAVTPAASAATPERNASSTRRRRRRRHRSPVVAPGTSVAAAAAPPGQTAGAPSGVVTVAKPGRRPGAAAAPDGMGTTSMRSAESTAPGAGAPNGVAAKPSTIVPQPVHHPLPKDVRPTFAHPSEEEFAGVLDFYRVEWQYEPTTFPLEWDTGGNVTLAFTPDFYLPAWGLYVELTTMKQSLVTRKNRKIRRLKELYPWVNIKVFYGRDFERLLRKYGVESTNVGALAPATPPAASEEPSRAAARPAPAPEPAVVPAVLPTGALTDRADQSRLVAASPDGVPAAPDAPAVPAGAKESAPASARPSRRGGGRRASPSGSRRRRTVRRSAPAPGEPVAEAAVPAADGETAALEVKEVS